MYRDQNEQLIAGGGAASEPAERTTTVMERGASAATTPGRHAQTCVARVQLKPIALRIDAERESRAPQTRSVTRKQSRRAGDAAASVRRSARPWCRRVPALYSGSRHRQIYVCKRHPIQG